MFSNLANPIVGAAVTGLTSPTYTTTEDVAPNSHGEQIAVTTLGGTQTGVVDHSVSSPFTLTWERPANLKQVGLVNPVTGELGSVPMNVYTLRVRKGMVPLAGQSPRVARFEGKFYIPAGADEAAIADIRALASILGGVFDTAGDEIVNTLETGVL